MRPKNIERLRRVQDALDSGVRSYKDISEITEIPIRSVSWYLRQLGVSKQWRWIPDEEFINAYNSGANTGPKIAAVVGCHRGTARKRARKLGLELYGRKRGMSPDEYKEWFFSVLDKPDGEDGCWIWIRGRNGTAYGWQDGQLAHRVAWRLAVGAIPKNLFVCHHCDNPPCCNPSHLFLGTNQDNIDDMVYKGRQKGGYAWKQKHGV